MFLLRPVVLKDVNDLVELAQHLDTVNFPNDEEKIEEGIHLSSRSFSSSATDCRNGIFQFALEDTSTGHVLGVSKLIARHGTEEQPHFYWQVSYDRRESKTIGIGMSHQVLTLGKDTRGFSEIAGIIVHPDQQGKSLGKLLFYVRFLYLFLRPTCFMDRIISELLPPLDRNGRSTLWEAYGRKFTALTYQEADQLSHDNKEFIEALFPQNEIYTCLLPLKARQVIGKVGPKSQAVRHLAQKNGMQYLEQIDPFDGGPHFGGRRDDIVCLQRSRLGNAVPHDGPPAGAKPGLLANAKATGSDFRAIEAQAAIPSKEEDRILVNRVQLEALGLSEGDQVAFLPYT